MKPLERMKALGRYVRTHPQPWVFAAILAVHVGRFIVRVPRDYYPGGDGYYIYMLARSMAYDFDIELTNDYALCGDPWAIGKDFGTGHPANPWFIGPALIWAPVLWVIKHLPLAADASPLWAQGCRGPHVWMLGLLAPVFVTLTVWLGYRIALRFVDRGVALTAAVVVAFGSLLAVFGPMWWNYSHVWAAACLTLACLLYVRTVEAPERVGRWVATGAALGLASLMRPHHMLWMIAPAILTCVEGAKTLRARRVPYREALRGLAALAAFGAVFYVRLGSYDYLYGSPWPPVLRSVYLQPAHAHPLLVLFSARAGLLTYAPLMWLAVIGFFLALGRGAQARVVWPLGVAFLVDFWICCSPLDWAGGATVGPRLLTSFCGMFVVWSALTLDVIRAFVARSEARLLRFATIGWLLPPLLLSWQLVNGDGPYAAPSIYGGGFRMLLDDVYEYVGNPVVFPAPIVFALRYHADAKDFDRVAQDGLFYHDFERGRLLGEGQLVFARPQPSVLLLEGLEPIPGGRRIRAGRPGRYVAPLAWPYVGAVQIQLAAPPGRDGCRIAVANALFIQRGRTANVRIARGATAVRIDTPAGMFDSGINETWIRSNCDLDLSSLRWLDAPEASDATPLPRYANDPRFR